MSGLEERSSSTSNTSAGKKRKRQSPFRIKVGGVVALRYLSQRRNCVVAAARTKDAVAAVAAPSTTTSVEVWTDPVAGRDEGMALIGRRIRGLIVNAPQPNGGKKMVEGEVISVVEFHPEGTVVDLLTEEKVLSRLTFLQRTDAVVDPTQLLKESARRNYKNEQLIRGKHKAVIQILLLQHVVLCKHKTQGDDHWYRVKWAIRRRVPAAVAAAAHKRKRKTASTEQTKKQKRRTEEPPLNGDDDTSNLRNDRETDNIPLTSKHLQNLIDTVLPASSVQQYLGDAKDEASQQIQNWRWWAARYHHQALLLRMLQPEDFFDDGLVGQVIQIHPGANQFTSLAMVTVQRLFLPEHTCAGRLPTHHTPMEVFEQNEQHIFQIPIEELLMIARTVLRRSTSDHAAGTTNKTRHYKNPDGLLEYMEMTHVYSNTFNRFFPISSKNQETDDVPMLLKDLPNNNNNATMEKTSKNLSKHLSFPYCRSCHYTKQLIHTTPNEQQCIISSSSSSTTTTQPNDNLSSETTTYICRICRKQGKKQLKDASVLEQRLSTVIQETHANKKNGDTINHDDDDDDDDALSKVLTILNQQQVQVDFGLDNFMEWKTIIPSLLSHKPITQRKRVSRKPNNTTAILPKKLLPNDSKKFVSLKKKLEPPQNKKNHFAMKHTRDDDMIIFKATCARHVPYQKNKGKDIQINNSYSISDLNLHDKPRNLRLLQEKSSSSTTTTTATTTTITTTTTTATTATTGNGSATCEDNQKKLSSRAQRAKQRRLIKGVAATIGVRLDSLAGREQQLRFDRSAIHAWGVFADVDISAGEMIVEYRGELIGNAMAEKREKEYELEKIGSDYMFRMDNNLVCDATKQGNVARFVNASCEPNCYTKIIPLDGSKRIVIYAKTDIRAGEELCYDYKFPLEYDASKRIPCYCGAKECRGYMNWDKRYVTIPSTTESSTGEAATTKSVTSLAVERNKGDSS